MAITVVIINQKGGVAKSTTASCFGFLAAREGRRVLLCDLDPQSSLTYSFIEPERTLSSRCLSEAVAERKGLPVVNVRPNLDLVPDSLRMVVSVESMYSQRRREYVLADLLRPVASRYDLIIVDCPPSLGLLSVNALAIADRVVVPSRADQLSYYGLQMLCSFVGGLADINPSVAVTDVFFTFYDPRMRLTKAVEESIRADYGSLVMRGVVRRGVAVSEPLADLRTVFEYKPESRVALDYVDVYREFCGRMGLE